jgi:hypothetical protein
MFGADESHMTSYIKVMAITMNLINTIKPQSPAFINILALFDSGKDKDRATFQSDETHP